MVLKESILFVFLFKVLINKIYPCKICFFKKDKGVR